MDEQAAAREYLVNIRALRSGTVSPDEHRAINRRLREDLGDAGWERAKVAALVADQKYEGR